MDDQARMKTESTLGYPLRLSIAYWVFVPTVLAQYALYWFIGLLRGLQFIEARTMLILENAVFDVALVAVPLAMVGLLVIAHATPDPRHRSNAIWSCAFGMMSLLPQILVGLLALTGFKDS